MSLMTGPINVPVYRSGDRWLTSAKFNLEVTPNRIEPLQINPSNRGADNPMDVLSCLLDNKVAGLRILTSKDPRLVRGILKDLKRPARFLRDNLIVGHFRPDRWKCQKFFKDSRSGWKCQKIWRSENDLVKVKNVRIWTKKCKNVREPHMVISMSISKF